MLSKRSIVRSTSSDLHLVHVCDQALSQKELEKTSLSEQLAALQLEQHSAAMELERTKRESLSKQEQDKVKKNKNKTITRASTHCFLALDVRMFPSERNG